LIEEEAKRMSKKHKLNKATLTTINTHTHVTVCIKREGDRSTEKERDRRREWHAWKNATKVAPPR